MADLKKKGINLNYFKPDKILTSQSCEEEVEGEADHYEAEVDISNSNEFLNLKQAITTFKDPKKAI